VWAEDTAGNRGPAARRTWTIAPETVIEPVAAGGTVTSDTEGDGATSTDPLETSITSPVAGPVEVTETVILDPSTAGYSFFGQQVNITAPASTPENPLKFAFRLDPSLVPTGEDQDTVQVFRNGVKVDACTDQSGNAAPDPCVLKREALADGDIEFTVLTSRASHWNVGIAAQDTTPPTGALKINNGAAKTTKAAVTLSLSANDNSDVVSEVRIRNAGGPWSGWMAYTATKRWTLAAGKGTRTVDVEYRDVAGNVSAASDSIKVVKKKR
jgi:hypothetical protein